jgi:hypothetical protein
VVKTVVTVDVLYVGIGIVDPALNGVTIQWMVDTAPMQPASLIVGPQSRNHQLPAHLGHRNSRGWIACHLASSC